MSLKGLSSNPSLVYGVSRLRALGLKEHQIAGVLGSLYQESNFNPKAHNPDDPGGSFGIAQWNGDRLAQLEAWADENDADMFAPETQWDFMAEELMTTEKGALDAVLNAPTVGQAADAWTRKFERPAQHGMKLASRRGFADQIASDLGFSRNGITGDTGSADHLLTSYSAKNPEGGSGTGGGLGSFFASEGESSGGLPPGQLRSGGWIDDGNPVTSAFNAVVSPGGGGTFGQSLGGVGLAIGGMPGMAIGSLLGGVMDSVRGRNEGGAIDSVGDSIDSLFGLTTPAGPVGAPVQQRASASDSSRSGGRASFAPTSSPRPTQRPSRSSSSSSSRPSSRSR